MVVDPFLWLSISILMVAVSLVIFLASLLPTIQELNRAVRGAEHLIETLNRELPTTLDALRSTSRELNHLTEDLGDGVESAKQIVQQVDRGLEETEKQLVQARITSQSAIAGAKAAWNAFFQVDRNRAKQPTSSSTDHVSSQLRKQPNANTLHVDENSHDHRTASKKSQL